MKRAVLLGFMLACNGGVRDVTARDAPRDDDAGLSSVAAAPSSRPNRRDAGVRADIRVLAKASTRALAMDETNLYFGSADDDAVYAVAKTGGVPVRLARRAPVAGGLACDGDSLTWIATPGDVVLNLPTKGGIARPIRERAIFVDVATSGAELFVAEATPAGGAITRISGGHEARSAGRAREERFASLETSPRAIVADAADVFVATSTKILRISRPRGEVAVITTGVAVESPVLDRDYVYFTHIVADERVIARVARAGGEPATVATRVATAPFAIEGSALFFFDGRRAEIRSVSVTGGASKIVATDDSFGRPNAILADAKSLYVASGEREDGAISQIAR